MVGIAVCLKGTLCAVAIVRCAKPIGEHSAPPIDLSRDNRWYVCNIVCSVEAGRHDILIGAGNGSKTCLSKVSVLNDRSAGALQPTFSMMCSHACRCALWCPLQTSQTLCTQHWGRQIRDKWWSLVSKLDLHKEWIPHLQSVQFVTTCCIHGEI